MHQKSVPRHPLRQFRESLGLSRPAFAKGIGTSEFNIEKIETGKTRGIVSPALATRLLLRYGIDPRSLTEETPRSVLGRHIPLDRAESVWQSFLHGKRIPPSVSEAISGFAEILTAKVQTALEAARMGDKEVIFAHRLDEFLREIIEELDLPMTTVWLLNDRAKEDLVPLFEYSADEQELRIDLGKSKIQLALVKRGMAKRPRRHHGSQVM